MTIAGILPSSGWILAAILDTPVPTFREFDTELVERGPDLVELCGSRGERNCCAAIANMAGRRVINCTSP